MIGADDSTSLKDVKTRMNPRVKFGTDVKTMFSEGQLAQPIEIPCSRNKNAFMPHSYGGKSEPNCLPFITIQVTMMCCSETSQ
jgi:hypothetical protein